jgi:hypothetical protein
VRTPHSTCCAPLSSCRNRRSSSRSLAAHRGVMPTMGAAGLNPQAAVRQSTLRARRCVHYHAEILRSTHILTGMTPGRATGAGDSRTQLSASVRVDMCIPMRTRGMRTPTPLWGMHAATSVSACRLVLAHTLPRAPVGAGVLYRTQPRPRHIHRSTSPAPPPTVHTPRRIRPQRTGQYMLTDSDLLTRP